MAWLFKELDRLQKAIQTAIQPGGASTSATAYVDVPLERPERINDNVYQVHKPAGRPSVEIVFFHGLQLEDSNEVYLTTWLSADGSELWLRWILKDFPNARILLVSYEQRHLDMYLTCENLVHNLTDENANVGRDGCPVILVGHSLGCLVTKELCVTLDSTTSKREEPVQNLLQNVKGFFYYSCPHQGSRLADMSVDSPTGPLLKRMRTLNKKAQRTNEKFSKLRRKYGWTTFGIGEAHKTTLGQFTDYIVPEASARYDVDGFYTYNADHFHVCRPESASSSNFVQLSNLIRSMVRQDRERQIPKVLTPEGIYGLVQHVDDIMEKLRKGVRRLGIVGMGGVGKTTLAEVVYETISPSFEYTCFFRDVKKSLENKNNLKQLRKKIIRKLCHKGRKVKDVFNWETLQGKKVLILLDDVEYESQVQVMLESDGFLDGSCVIVTSRDKGFLQREKFEYHAVENLDKEDSKKIFCQNAFGKEVVESGYEYSMEQFLKKCEGLPLALKVVGKYLYGQEQRVWEDGLLKLKHAKPLNGSKEDGLWSILRVCYESLAEIEQEMFLDVATCFHNQDLEKVEQAWSVCPWASPATGLKNLQDKGLVTIEESTIIEENSLPRQERIIRMHEVLRDLGRSIACPSNKNVGTHTRQCFDLSNPLQISQLFNAGKPQVKVLTIDRCEDISVESLQGLEELKILWLEDVSLRGPLHLLPTNLAYMALTDSSLFVQTEGSHSRSSDASEERENKRRRLGQHSALQRLEIKECKLLEGSLDSLGEYQALEHLEISSLLNWTAIPNSFGELLALTHLRVVSCDQLQSIPPSLKHLQALKHLVIQDCQKIEAMPDFEGGLQALKLLVVSCGCLKAPFNVLWQLRALERFETTGCQDWKSLLHWVGQLEALQKISIHTCIDHGYPVIDQLQLLESLARRRLLQRVEQVDLPMFHEDHALEIIGWNSDFLPSNFVGRGRARNLLIKDCGNLRALPDTLGRFQVLEDLRIVNCGSLEALPVTIGELKALKSLSIISCKSLKSLPTTVKNLQALTQLLISCDSLRAPPQNLQQLKAFRLDITWCQLRYWKGFLDTLERLQALQKLVIHSCIKHRVPASTDQFDFLESLTRRGVLQGIGQVDLPVFHQEQVEIFSCSFPNQTYGLGHAHSLLIQDRRNVKVLPDTLGELRALQKLSVQGCEWLTALPDTLGKLEALRQLKIGDCYNLRALPDSLGELRALQILEIMGGNQLGFLPEHLGKLEALQQLKIYHCYNLKALPDSLGQLRALQILAIMGCNQLEFLPEHLGKLEALQQLKIGDWYNLKALPDSLGELRALQILEIMGCNQLEFLPEHLGKLEALQQLKIYQCYNLKALPDSLGELTALQILEIIGCKQLEFLPEHLGKLEALQQLKIYQCYNLKALPDSLGQLRALQILEIMGCNQLEFLPEHLGKLEALQQLKIGDCYNLKALPDSLGELRALQILEIMGCNQLEFLPEHLGKLEALQQLKIGDCYNLKALPDSLGELRALQILEIMGCNQLEFLPEHLGKLEALQQLKIGDCYNLKALPDSLGELRALQILEIMGCNQLEFLPEHLGKLEALQQLKIYQCYNLKALPDSLGELRALQILEIIGCKQLEFLPEHLGKLEALQQLKIYHCYNLKALPDSLGELRALQILEIMGCNQLEFLPEHLGKLEALQQLKIYQCYNLKALPDSLGELTALQILEIIGCKQLEFLPEHLGKLAALQQLKIGDCYNLKALPDSLGELRVLSKFQLERCGQLKSVRLVPAQKSKPLGILRIEHCKSLESVEIKSCQLRKNHTCGFETLLALEILCIEDWNFKALPGYFWELRTLCKFEIKSCRSLKSLPDSLRKLRTLKTLSIEDCNNLETLPDSLGMLSALECFSVVRCKSLRALPDTLGELSGLRKLRLEECNGLISLPKSLQFIRITRPSVIEITSCQHLRFLPPLGCQ